MKITSLVLCFCLLTLSVPAALAQKTAKLRSFKVNAIVNDGKKVKEKSTKLVFAENSVVAKNGKTVFKEFNYADIVEAEYSNSIKPLMTGTKKVLALVFLGPYSMPFFLIQIKQYWISLRTADDYLVLRLERSNYKKVFSELEKHNITVKSADDDKNSIDQVKN